MSNGTGTLELCSPPFLLMSEYPYTGGDKGSRLCAPGGPGGLVCCLPCPVTDWVYPDNFKSTAQVASWIGVGSLVCCIFLLLSFVCLPVQKTGRHYLTVCLVVSVTLLTLAFVVPLSAKPQQCHDAITPNDMSSDLTCAFSGAFVIAGGFGAVMWVFIRSLSLYLQICRQITPGRKFFYAAQLGGWGNTAVVLALSLSFSGVAYRFGDTCHIHHRNGIAVLWGPLLAFAGLGFVLQIITFGYCIKVYIRSVRDPNTQSTSSTYMRSNTGSIVTGLTARAAYKRARKVIALQWRGITVVIIVIVSAIFFSVVFMKLDDITIKAAVNNADLMPWLLCLLATQGDKNKCLKLARPLILSESTTLAVLFLLAFIGVWCLLFLGRTSMLSGWRDILGRPFARPEEHFVSFDAKRLSTPHNYEMLSSPIQQLHMTKTEEGTLIATTKGSRKEEVGSSAGFSPPPSTVTTPGPSALRSSIRSPDLHPEPTSYFSQADIPWRSPNLSFSSPRPPTRSASNARNVAFADTVVQPSRSALALPEEPAPTAPRTALRRDGSANSAWYRANPALGVDRSNSTRSQQQAAVGLFDVRRSSFALSPTTDADRDHQNIFAPPDGTMNTHSERPPLFPEAERPATPNGHAGLAK